MVKSIVAIFFAIVSSNSLRAQSMDFKWVKHTGASESGYDKKSIAVDAEGNVYTAGCFSGTVDFDAGPGEYFLSSADTTPVGTAAEDMFVSKLDAAGSLIWVKQMSSEYYSRSNSIAIDAQGNVYTIGEFTGSVDFDPGPGTFYLTTDFYSFDMFMSKLDQCGNFVWAKQIGGITNDHVYGNSIALDASGYLYITGNFDGNAVDFDPGAGVHIMNINTGISSIFVARYNANGGLIWAKQTVAHSEYDNVWGASSESIALDASGNIYTTGFFGGTIDFDPGGGAFLLNNIFGNNFILKLDPSGNFLWANQMGQGSTKSFVWGKSIAIDLSGNVYTSGYFFGSVDFDPGPAVYNLSTVTNTQANVGLYISKLNTSGSFVWTKLVAGSGSMALRSFQMDGSSICLDAAGNIYTTGAFNGTVDFDPGTGVHNLTSAGNADIFVSKLDGSGDLVWVKQVACVKSGYSNSMKLDVKGNIYTAGAFSGLVDFDPGIGVYNITSSGSTTNIFVNKMTQCTGNNSSPVMKVTSCSNYTWNCKEYNATGVYTQAFINVAGCDSIVTLNLTIDRSNLVSVVDVTACGSYLWQGQTLTNSGIYTDTLVTANGCDSIVTLQLAIKATPVTTLNKIICQGENYEGHITSGIYTDTLVAANGCDSLRILQLTVLSKPAPNLGADKGICSVDSLTLSPGQFDTYLWGDGSTQNSVTIRNPGLYSVEVTNKCGPGRDEIMITEKVCDIYFPSAFTPNNDGRNDLFKILGGNNLTDFRLIIYDRWGQKIFETFDFAKGWDGNFNGRLQSSGVFVWYCEYKEPGSAGKTNLRGTVTLVR